MDDRSIIACTLLSGFLANPKIVCKATLDDGDTVAALKVTSDSIIAFSVSLADQLLEHLNNTKS